MSGKDDDLLKLANLTNRLAAQVELLQEQVNRLEKVSVSAKFTVACPVHGRVTSPCCSHTSFSFPPGTP